MQVISMSQNKYKQLTKMNLPKEVFNTEAIIYDFRYKGQDKVFKKLLNNTGVNLANKLYTLEMLDVNRKYLPENLCIPDYLTIVGGVVEGFTMPKIEGVNLSTILRNKNYFQRKGGVTFSGGEPLLQSKFIIEVARILKKENIHIALDTAGVGNGDYEKILEYIDLVILDIKHTDPNGYLDLTGQAIDESLKFIDALNKSGKDVWIRQVIVPGIMDNDEYLESLVQTVKKIKNVQRIEFLPYHKLGSEKYVKLGIYNPYQDMPEMDKERCNQLYQKFMNMYENM